MKKTVIILLLIFFALNCAAADANIAQELEKILNQKQSLDIIFFEQCVISPSLIDWQCKALGNEIQTLDVNESNTLLNYGIEVYNRTNKSMKIYSLVKKDSWKENSFVMELEAFEKKRGDFYIDVNYAGKEFEEIEIAVLGLSEEKNIKKIISIQLDWKEYGLVKQEVSGIVLPSIGISALVLAIMSIIAIGIVFSGRKQLPPEKGEKTKNIFARIILHPGFWVIALAIAAWDTAYTFNRYFNANDVSYTIESFIVSSVFAITFPLIFLIIIWLVDFYEREPLHFIISMFLWGMVAAAISLVLNTAIIGSVGSIGILGFIFGAIAIAPLVEELSKGLGVFAMSKHREMQGALDGIVYGFCIGLGFAVTENLLYFTRLSPAIFGGNLTDWLFVLFYRSLFCCLSHGWMTATTGGLLGYFKRKTGSSKLLYFLTAVSGAIILHATANASILPDAITSLMTGSYIPFFNPLVDTGLTLIFAIAIFGYLRKDKERLMALLGKKNK
ncbi:MAG: PrsW family intramembrane metalloprotease [Candidatus Diapherotrites archaeon]|nr:PrsW family intramembrane metalloprotease [Candidatus Diapherotrites archaeon]